MKRFHSAFWKIVVFLLFCVQPALLHANGQTEDKLKEAQALIDAKEFDKALLVLEDVGLREKDRLPEVQVYINICMEHAASVNELKQQILDELDKNDDEAAISLMDRLKALDPKELDFLGDAYEVKKLKLAYKKFQEIMDAAYAFIPPGKYQEAIDTYRQGFTLYRDEFLANPAYDKIDVAAVQDMYIRIDALIAEYFAKAAVAEKSCQSVADLFADGRLAEGLARSEAARNDLSVLLDLRWRLIAAGRRFQEENDYFKKKSPDGKGDNLFYFSLHTILGREPETITVPREGLYYVVEAHWEALLERTAELFRTNAVRFFALARDADRTGNSDQADAQYAQAAKFAEQGASFLGLYTDSGAPTAPRKLDSRDRKYLREKFPPYEYLTEIALESLKYRELLGLQKQYDAISGRAVAPGDASGLRKSQAEVSDKIALLEIQAASLETRRLEVERFATAGFDMAETARSLPDVSARCAGLLDAFRRLNIGYSAKIMEGELAPLRDAYADRQKRLADATAVRDGTPSPPAPKSGEKRPSDALKLYDALKRDMDKDNPAEQFLARWKKEGAVFLTDPAIKGFIGEAETLAADMKTLRDKLDAESDRALAMRDEAKEFYKRGLAEFQQANLQLNNKAYQEASRQLALSKKDVADSRADEETEDARALAANIADLEKKIRAASVDARIAEYIDSRDRGIERYFLQDFEGARVLLERAKKLLIDLATQANGEVDVPDTSVVQLWLDLVLKALASAPVRRISQKDPLYAEITARQKQAEQSYQVGLDFQKKGDAAEAQKSFQDALDQIQQIQKTFPQLKESGVLYVKVMRTQKGEAWFSEYIDGLIREAERKEPRQALAELEDALTLEPGNQQLKQALERVTAKLYVKPVVSAQARGDAEKLSSQAADLIRPVSATRSDWEQALKLVNQSLVLDPYSAKAKDLQTRILKVIYGR
jgi:hypothetical protein